MNVLVVDDSWVMRRFIIKQLKACGLEIDAFYEAGHGIAALEMLENTEIDLITTDIHMPEMDGVAFVRELSKNSVLGRIPLVAISSDSTSGCTEQMRELGALGFLGKPFQPEDFLAEFRRVEGLMRTLQASN